MRKSVLALLAVALLLPSAVAQGQTNPPPNDGRGGHECERTKKEQPTS